MAVDLYTTKEDARGGMWSSLNLTRTALAHPKVVYKDKLLTFDLYESGGQLMVNLYCPKCEHSLRIEQKHKKIEWDEGTGLFIESFRCTWELDLRGDERIAFGLNLCGWTVAVEPTNREMDTNEGRIRIHGIAKDS